MKTYVMVLAMVLGFGSVAWADVTISGTQVTATITEPSVDGDGGVLDDLKETYVTYEIIDAVLGGMGENPCGPPMAATALSGGGEVSTSCVIPTQQNAETVVTFRGRSTDLVGNISDPPDEVTKTIDLLSPGSPTF